MNRNLFEPGLGQAPILDGDIYKPLSTIATVAGLQAALDTLQGGINGKANTSHTHTIGQITGLQATLDTKLNKAGDTITGNLWFNKSHLDTSGDIYAVRNDGNTGVIFLNGAGSRYLYYNGSNYELTAAPLYVGGNISSSGIVTAFGVVNAGNGAAYLNTDGNVYGPRWGVWGYSNYAFDAIENRIEVRATAKASEAVANRPTGDQCYSLGFWGGDGAQPYMNGAPGVVRLVGANANVDTMGVFALLAYTGPSTTLGPNQLITSAELQYANAAANTGSRPQGTWMLFGHISGAINTPGRIAVWQRKY